MSAPKICRNGKHIEVREFATLAGDMIPTIGTVAFASSIQDFFRQLTQFDMFIAVYYRDRIKPVELVFVNQPQHPPETLDIYRAGAYRLDPIFSCCANDIAPGVYTLRSLTPTEFAETPYYQTFYGNLGLGDEADFFVKTAAGGYVVITLARNRNRPDFSQEELRQLSEVSPLVNAVVSDHLVRSNWSELVYHSEGGQDSNLSRVFVQLSDREREVATLILQGFSSEAIGLRLNISENTVKVHRRNVYEKLEVTSITELFVVFLQDCGVDITSVFKHLTPCEE